MKHPVINIKFSMKFFYISVIVILITSCTDSLQNKYCRTWKMNLSNQDESIFIDTVDNSFMPMDSLTRHDTTFFRTCFTKPVNLWVKGSYSASFYKILLCEKVLYKNDSIKIVKCITSLDSNREDHILSFLVLENIGIIYEANPSRRSNYILEKMVDTKTNKSIIDSNYVKSIYPPNPIPKTEPSAALRRWNEAWVCGVGFQCQAVTKGIKQVGVALSFVSALLLLL